jgi:hypothetical protein
MNIETQLLNALKIAQAQFSVEALRRPHDKTEFEYGFRVGVIEGFDKSIKTLLSILDEEKNGTNDI